MDVRKENGDAQETLARATARDEQGRRRGQDHAAEGKARSSRAGAECRTLLVVDDEPSFARSLSGALSALDPALRVLTAPDGLVARETIEREHVDLVLTDLRMPVMDGYELLSTLARSHPEVPVLVMTAFGSPEVAERLRPFGVGEIIEKPVDFGSLSERIISTLEAATAFGAARGQLAGQLGVFSPFELLQLLCNMQRAGTLELNRIDGTTARCTVFGGGLVRAECGHLRDREAVLSFLWWRKGIFVYEAKPDLVPEEEIIGVPGILLEAVRLADEVESRKELVPPRDASLFLSTVGFSSEEPITGDAARVLDLVQEYPGITACELEVLLPFAPVTLRLALACLVEAGHVESTPRRDAPPKPEPPGWWRALTSRYPGGLRALVALNPDEAGAHFFRAIASLGKFLGASGPSVSYSPDGPSFVRLRPPWGGILSLTFLPLARKYRELFASFVRSVQAVLIFDEGEEREEWMKLVPPDIRVVPLETGRALEDQIAERLDLLQPPPGAIPVEPVTLSLR